MPDSPKSYSNQTPPNQEVRPRAGAHQTRHLEAQTTRREKAILALLQQPTLEKAAEAAGVHPATLYRWRKEPEFQKAVLAARREAYSQVIGRLQQAAAAAAGTLLRIMADGQAPAGSRVQASKCVLDQASKGLENEDLLIRITQLENSQAQIVAGNLAGKKP